MNRGKKIQILAAKISLLLILLPGMTFSQDKPDSPESNSVDQSKPTDTLPKTQDTDISDAERVIRLEG